MSNILKFIHSKTIVTNLKRVDLFLSHSLNYKMESKKLSSKTPRAESRSKAARRIRQVRKQEQAKIEKELLNFEVENFMKHHLPRRLARVDPNYEAAKFSQEQARLNLERKQRQHAQQEKLEKAAQEEAWRTSKEVEEKEARRKEEALMKFQQSRQAREASRNRSQLGQESKIAVARVRQFKKQTEEQKKKVECFPKKIEKERESRPKQKPLVRKTAKVSENPEAAQFCIEQARAHKDRQKRQSQMQDKLEYKFFEELQKHEYDKEIQKSLDKFERRKNMERNRMGKKKMEEETEESWQALQRVKLYQQKFSNSETKHPFHKQPKVTQWR